MRYFFKPHAKKHLTFQKSRYQELSDVLINANKNRTHRRGTKGQIYLLCRVLGSSTETRTSTQWRSANKERHMLPEVERKPRNVNRFGVNQKRKYPHQTPDSESSKSLR